MDIEEEEWLASLQSGDYYRYRDNLWGYDCTTTISDISEGKVIYGVVSGFE